MSEIDEGLRGLKCPTCDYDLTGLREHRCPECGDAFDPVRLRSGDPRLESWRSVRFFLMVEAIAIALQFVPLAMLRSNDIVIRTIGLIAAMVGIVMALVAHPVTFAAACVECGQAAWLREWRTAAAAAIAAGLAAFGFFLMVRTIYWIV